MENNKQEVKEVKYEADKCSKLRIVSSMVEFLGRQTELITIVDGILDCVYISILSPNKSMDLMTVDCSRNHIGMLVNSGGDSQWWYIHSISNESPMLAVKLFASWVAAVGIVETIDLLDITLAADGFSLDGSFQHGIFTVTQESKRNV